ncbi:MAG: reductive dehalogenase domain-containing protein [Pseudomonadota bacterium]
MSVFFAGTGVAISMFLFGFSVVSLMERQMRAAAISLTTGAAFAAAWIAVGMLLPGYSDIILASTWGVIALCLLVLMLPIGNKQPMAIDEQAAKRVDERDIMFSRMLLQEGSSEMRQYYGELRPDLAETDKKLRALPRLGDPGSKYYDPAQTPCTMALFEVIEGIGRHVGPKEAAAKDRAGITAREATKKVKQLAKRLGAADVKTAKLKDCHVYSHTGRGEGTWGKEISLTHSHAIVISVEMDYQTVQQAPQAATMTETAARYVESAAIAIALADFCASLGYSARAHMDSNYQVLCTALAHDAGIGKLGRLGMIMTPRLGPRVRLAAVTTDLPLEEDGRVNFGVQDFCGICLKCARCCPGGAISSSGKTEVNGATKWQSSQEACYRVWRKYGTDCCICMAVCPHSKPDTFYHGLVRFFCSRSGPARRLALHLDGLFYGKNPRRS